MVNWVTFTSFNGGNHDVRHADDLDGVIGIIESTIYTEECQVDNYESFNEIRKKLESLKFKDNIWIRWENSTWMTIQRFGGDVKEFFPITSICKDDMLLNGSWTDGEKKIIESWPKHMMEKIASKMADAYMDNCYWGDLEDITRYYVKAEED